MVVLSALKFVRVINFGLVGRHAIYGTAVAQAMPVVDTCACPQRLRVGLHDHTNRILPRRGRAEPTATSGHDGLVTVPNIRRRSELMLCTDFKAFETSKSLIQSSNHFCYTIEGILGY